MKKISFLLMLGFFLLSGTLYAGEGNGEGNGNGIYSTQARRTVAGAGLLNIGAGLGYYSGIPLSLDYEFGVSRDITIAPTLGLGLGYGGFSVGAKGRFYFDDIFQMDRAFDLYGGVSLGVVPGQEYYGGETARRGYFYTDLHVGARYHLTPRFGMFLDVALSSASLGASIRF
ncbi:hypothetical protein [Algivirga pacifica]|uniref:Outer membrane protein beta-barrel domain-containing protein n=1 Tax=Algivirga pacifica TaxID=1162670 RepID=A0ABP9D3N0_9BACT